MYLIFLRNLQDGRGYHLPQHHFSQKDVRKCIISESPIPELFKTPKIIIIRSIMMEKDQNVFFSKFLLQILSIFLDFPGDLISGNDYIFI